MGNNGSLIINGIRIDSGVLRKAAIRRCGDIKCMGACCSDGVWLCEDEPPRILEWAKEIKACLPPDRHDESKWFEQGKKEMGTVAVDDPMRPNETCCVFLQPDRKCALHAVSQANNLGWPGVKPFYCAIYPLYTEDGALLLDNITSKNITGAMCRHAMPLRQVIYKLFREEVTLVLGEAGYRELCEKAEAKG
jgi:Fe-S-cluster containining protein